MARKTAPSFRNAKGWTTVNCTNLKSIGGVKDFYLTASGVSGEAIVRNIVFASSSGENVCNQAPCNPISGLVANKAAPAANPLNPHSSVSFNGGVYTVHFDNPGNYEVFAFNPMGQLMARRSTNGTTDVRFSNLPKGKYIFKSIRR